MNIVQRQENLELSVFKFHRERTIPAIVVVHGFVYRCVSDGRQMQKPPVDSEHGLGHFRCPLCKGTVAKRAKV